MDDADNTNRYNSLATINHANRLDCENTVVDGKDWGFWVEKGLQGARSSVDSIEGAELPIPRDCDENDLKSNVDFGKIPLLLEELCVVDNLIGSVGIRAILRASASSSSNRKGWAPDTPKDVNLSKNEGGGRYDDDGNYVLSNNGIVENSISEMPFERIIKSRGSSKILIIGRVLTKIGLGGGCGLTLESIGMHLGIYMY
jgi:hypothetical protein